MLSLREAVVSASFIELQFDQTAGRCGKHAPCQAGWRQELAIMMKFEDLKNLNPKTPGAWPWPAKIIAFVTMFCAVVLAGVVFVWQGQWRPWAKSKQRKKSLRRHS